ncbi:MAG: DUF6421 family protein [Solirubrobacterales bacterium]
MNGPDKSARVLFEESHGEAWTIRPELARTMQPAHPEDSSLALAASTLSARDFRVAAHTDGPLGPGALGSVDALVIAHPSEPKWEATVGGSPRFTRDELDAIDAFVAAGCGLVVLAETEEDKYGANLGELLGRFGVGVESATVQDYEHNAGAPSWVSAELVRHPAGDRGDSPPGPRPDLLAGVDAATFYRAGTLAAANGARVLARTSPAASPPGAPLALVTTHGEGRVAVFADSDLFGDDCIAERDHSTLWLDLLYWAAGPAFRAKEPPAPSPAADSPAWQTLKQTVELLRATQEPDGSVDSARHDPGQTTRHTQTAAAALSDLAPHFPHQADYIDALRADLETWARANFAKPAFDRSLAAFRPDRERRDGIEHLVLFPMYKQNASRETCFEALIVRTPWPEWLAELERERYDNRKCVPVCLVDNTSGYDSGCAVLFPETVSTAERPPNEFGGIFCDREAERFRRVCGAAVDVVGLNLPPDAAALLTSPKLTRDAYTLWDLIHDRTHSHGDLPFDPFMIRQRSPYWMYSLEELRCDLTAFGEAVKLEREGLGIARHVQYAILFDRIFRFPITGSRVRNYDGLGGQLLFAYLHREGFLHWTDNRLSVEWDRVADGVGGLAALVHELYHSGIDRPKLAQWIAAHDLVAAYVTPAESSQWRADRRALPDFEEPKQLVDLVREDEFPLSLFYLQLRRNLEPAIEISRDRLST